MKVPLSWLSEASGIKAEANEFAKKLTDTGTAVESVQVLGENIQNIVLGKVISLEKHPNADKLLVTKVDIGRDMLQIITGATNLVAGDVVPVALDGAVLADGKKIKNSKIRGESSFGMLCSIEELGATQQEFPEAHEDGIYVFDDINLKRHPLGSDARVALDLLDTLFDFEILANRPDTNCVIGLAREAAAAFDQPFSPPEILVKEGTKVQVADNISIQVKDRGRCPRYVARVVAGVKIGPSPQWMRRRLAKCGIRPVNNIVDITNYVMLEYGQPLHAFDLEAVAQRSAKQTIIVRTSLPDETITTLDGVTRTLPEHTLVIADTDKAIGIAGVMGGAGSMIRPETRSILVESANFAAQGIRHTSRALGLRTDASARYEKGCDPHVASVSMERFAQLVEELGCGTVLKGSIDVFHSPSEERVIPFDPANINKLLGVSRSELSKESIAGYLRRVGIVTHGAVLVQSSTTPNEAVIPTNRMDVTCEADLAEEVARFFGYNNIPSRYTQSMDGLNSLPAAGWQPSAIRKARIKELLVAQGYFEALTFPFQGPKAYEKLGVTPDMHISIINPLSQEYSLMRSERALLSGLLECISHNQARGNPHAALFEVVYAYKPHRLPLVKLPQEIPYLTVAGYGADFDFFTIKGDIENLISGITPQECTFTPCSLSYMHPGRSAKVSIRASQNPRDPAVEAGFFGELHPAIMSNFNLTQKTYVACFGLNVLDEIAQAAVFKYVPPYAHPALNWDLAFKVARDIPADVIQRAIKDSGGPLLAEIKLFDCYYGPQVGEGYKSMAYSLVFRSHSGTLKALDVEKPILEIISSLSKKLGAEIRDQKAAAMELENRASPQLKLDMQTPKESAK